MVGSFVCEEGIGFYIGGMRGRKLERAGDFEWQIHSRVTITSC